MRFFLLKPERGAEFRRYAELADNGGPKCLRFSPGVITAVNDDDVKFLCDSDIHPECLTEITDEQLIQRRGFAYANGLDVPPADEQAPETHHADESKPIENDAPPKTRKNKGKKPHSTVEDESAEAPPQTAELEKPHKTARKRK
jgi:hypothetical protein